MEIDSYVRFKDGTGLGGTIGKVVGGQVYVTIRIRILHSTNPSYKKNERLYATPNDLEPLDQAIGRMVDD